MSASPASSRVTSGRPSLARRMRRQLGRWKCLCLDRWPYLPLVRLGEIRRAQHREWLLRLPPIVPVRGPAAEVHMLCGHRDADMGLWASWSLLRFLPGADLHVHSDGSLDENDLALWRRIVPAATFTTPAERARRAAGAAAAYPRLAEWREHQCYGAKFLDAHLHGRRDRIVLLDSDVLCFERPDELIAALGEAGPVMRWNADCVTSYSANPDTLRRILGARVPEKVNTGFLLTKRWDDSDLAAFDRTLALLAEAGVAIHDRWAEQMLYALAAGRHVSAGAFSRSYAVTLGRLPAEAVIRHYVGVPRVRPRFHTEGVPRLLRQLDELTPLSAPTLRTAPAAAGQSALSAALRPADLA